MKNKYIITTIQSLEINHLVEYFVATTSYVRYFQMWSNTAFFLTIIIRISMSEFDRDQYEYLKQKYQIECGTSAVPSSLEDSPIQGTSADSTSRIINGISSKETYPWIADVVKFIAYDPRFDPITKFSDGDTCGGAILSDKVILTAGHCVCKGIMHPRDILNSFPYPILETCLEGKIEENGKLIEKNQNRKGLNELHIHVGERVFDAVEWSRQKPEFDTNIEGYLYEYSRPHTYDDMFHTFSEAGDIGIVIKRDGLPLAKGRVNIVPICLPSPKAFAVKNGFKVKVAGRGRRYQKSTFDIDSSTVVSSCLTNEGTTTPIRNFAPCMVQLDGEYCYNLLNEDINSFSINDDLVLISNKWLNQIDYKNCEEYYREAKEAWIKKMMEIDSKSQEELNKEFDQKVQRIQIRQESDLGAEFHVNVLETCYNFKTLGGYGICQLNKDFLINKDLLSVFDADALFNWGFCSRSCNYKDKADGDPDDPYEEAIFEYFEEAPPITLFASK